ncbi:MAG: hypothetical protein H6825_05985 [Planctomycetes bacterium]|nr:hypothetical protein [Planctomycetota bacterium]
MRPLIRLTSSAALAALLLAGCGRPELDSVLDRTAQAVDELSSVLADVRDSDTLAQLRPKIDALGDEIARLRDEAADLARRAVHDPALQEAATAARERLERAVASVRADLDRIAEHPELNAALGRLRETLGSLLDDAPR